MWAIISIALLIALFIEKSIELKMCFLIAAGLFAIANEVNMIVPRMKELFRATVKEESNDEN